MYVCHSVCFIVQVVSALWGLSYVGSLRHFYVVIAYNIISQIPSVHSSAKLRSPPLYVHFLFVCVFSFFTNSTLSFVFTRTECHLTIITLIQWIEINTVLLSMIMIGPYTNLEFK